ncbi:MAG: DNA-binding response regulator [Microbacterium sp.]|uniref:response regulator transcription factor n=1 Tax=unclassified Microbacterium TaxID=2609290 RepID=UPI000DB3E8B1|nr:response regulator transcription factor [Microbacterium sp.]PZU41180.1 MAG: DNA-binding response regulator [Microbacterium sp.]
MEQSASAHAAVRVLVVDDDEGIRVLLQSILAAPRFDTSGVAGAAEALVATRAQAYDVILLDRFLPEVDAVQLLTPLRVAAPAAALIMLSAVDDVDGRVQALRAGADDFLTKPFHVSEVIARIDAVRRRGQVAADDPETVRYADLEIDVAGRRARRSGEVLPVTPTELKLLAFLAANAERVLSRGQLLEHVWGYDLATGADVVEKAISTLRKKVDAGRQPLIQTVRGFGYCLRTEIA